MMSMKVSIVIPVYNAEKYLVECLDSALNQSYSNLEIIAVNDGSKDDSLEILKGYEDKIKVISKKNGGTATALNTGIRKMEGEWFKWLSADDALYPNAVEELVNSAKQLESKNYILYSNYDIIDSNGKVISQFTEPNYNELGSFDFNVILLDHYLGNGTTSLIHKSSLDKFGIFDETLGFQEDYELWLRFCLQYNCRLHLVPKVLAKYRVHETQLTKAKLTQAKVGESLENRERFRSRVLNHLSSEQREKYKIALKQFKKNKPLKVKGRHALRDAMFKVLPKSSSHRILKFYLDRKKDKISDP